MNDFIANLRWLAEQRRLRDLEQRWREAERQALRELYLSLEDNDQEEVNEGDEGEGDFRA
jgi:hypothetical protein